MIEYTKLKCSVCALDYACDKVYMDHRKFAPKTAKDRDWYCPNGHGQEFTASAHERERKRRLEAEAREKSALAALESAKRSAAAYKGHVTRLSKKVREGVCPACEQTFPALQQHMQEEHPDWDPVEVGE